VGDGDDEGIGSRDQGQSCVRVPGSPFVPGKVRWDEAATFELSRSGYELVVFCGSPDEARLASARVATVHFAICVEMPIIQVCWRYEGSDGWQDASVSWHTARPEGRSDSAKTARRSIAKVALLIVDANTGIVMVKRHLAMPGRANELLIRSLDEQASRNWDEQSYAHAQASLHRRIRSSSEMAKAAQILVRLRDVASV